MNRLLLSAVAAMVIATSPARAAFITIDDSDPNTVTVIAGDFEGGFSVNGTFLTSGIGVSASITLPDGAHSFSGSWLDAGIAGPGGVEFALGPASAPGEVTSYLLFDTSSNGVFGTITGDVFAFRGTSYGATSGPTVPQDGRTLTSDVSFLSVVFVTETPVPVPASLALLGAGLAGLGLLRRRN